MQRYQSSVLLGGPGCIKPAPYAAITVYLAGTLTLAELFETNDHAPLVNPFQSDDQGNFFFYAEDGRYDIHVVVPGRPEQWLRDTLLEDINEDGLVHLNDIAVKDGLIDPVSSWADIPSVGQPNGVGSLNVQAQALAARTKQNRDRLDALNGIPSRVTVLEQDTATLEVEVADLQERALNGDFFSYETDADMQADLPNRAEGDSLKVTNDPDPAKNGYYTLYSGVAVYSELQPLQQDALTPIVDDIEGLNSDVSSLDSRSDSLEKTTADIYRMTLDPWALVHVDKNNALLMGLSNSGVLVVPNGADAPGVARVGPTTDGTLEANTDEAGRVISRWMTNGRRQQMVDDGSFKTVYDPAQIAGIDQRVSVLESGGSSGAAGLDLRDALMNPLRDCNLLLIGDSITWGVKATGNSNPEPRSQQLTDPRNNFTAPTWSNLLRKYLICAYTDALTTDQPVEDQPGSGYFTKPVAVDVFHDPRVKVVDSVGTTQSKTGTAEGSGPLFAIPLNVPPGMSMQFDIQAAEFEITFGTSSVDAGAEFEVVIDDVSVDAVAYYEASPSWGHGSLTQVAFGRHVVKITNTSESATLRVEGIQRVKQVRVANQGIIGTTTMAWLPGGSLLPAAARADDTHTIIMLGINDRHRTEYPLNVSRTKTNLTTIATYCRDTLGLDVTLMSEISAWDSTDFPTVTDPVRYYSAQDIRRVTAEIAAEQGFPFVDMYAMSRDLLLDGVAYSDDGLHPNDVGQQHMYDLVRKHIAGA